MASKKKSNSTRKPKTKKASKAPAARANTSNTVTRAKTPRELFLEAIATVGNVSAAAKAVPMNRCTHYEWLEQDSAYLLAFEAAREEYRDLVRETVRNRAINGTPQEIYFQGKFLGFRHEVSDRLLELEAKAHCPEYRDKHEITGVGGGPVVLNVLTGVPQAESD